MACDDIVTVFGSVGPAGRTPPCLHHPARNWRRRCMQFASALLHAAASKAGHSSARLRARRKTPAEHRRAYRICSKHEKDQSGARERCSLRDAGPSAAAGAPNAPASRPTPPLSPLLSQLRLPSMAPAYSLKKSHLPPADAARCCSTAAHSLPAVMHAIKDLEVDNPRDEPTLAQR
jgi:hypothetical protein